MEEPFRIGRFNPVVPERACEHVVALLERFEFVRGFYVRRLVALPVTLRPGFPAPDYVTLIVPNPFGVRSMGSWGWHR